MTIRLFVFGLAILLALPAGAQQPDRSQPPAVGEAPSLDLPDIARHRLSNGVEVSYIEKHDVPLVQMNIILDVGTVDDPEEMPGLASLTAALIDEGAGELSALELADALEFLGARFFVTAREHHTILGLRVPPARFEEAARLVADVLLRPHFDPEELDRLRRDRLTTLIRRHDEPTQIAGALFDRILFGEDHPYGRPGIGTEAFLRNVTAADVRAFYEQTYVPARAKIVMAGAVSPQILSALDGVLADWTVAGSPRSMPATPGQVEGLRIYLVDVPGAAQSVIRIGHVGVPRDVEDYYALNVLNTVLGGSFTSRLNQNLREDKGYTYGAGSAFDYRPLPGPFSASASVFTGVTGPALQEFMHELHGILEPIPEDEVRRARNFLAMRYPQNFESVSRIAAQLGDVVMYDLPDDYLNQYTERIQRVTTTDVQEAARRYLDPGNMAIVVVGDRGAIEESIRELDLAPVELLEVTDVLGAVPVLADTGG